jgi:hypothetical protein
LRCRARENRGAPTSTGCGCITTATAPSKGHVWPPATSREATDGPRRPVEATDGRASPTAVAAVEDATQRLDDGRTYAVDIVVEPHLVVRGTTASPADRQACATRPDGMRQR